MSTNNRALSIDQGSSKTFEFTITNAGTPAVPFDLTGYAIRLQVRRSFGAPGSPLINATTQNSKLVVTSAENGKVELRLLPEDTVDIRFNDREDASLVGVYDLEIVSPANDVYKPAKGNFTINREVTR